MLILKNLFIEKNAILKGFLDRTKNGLTELKTLTDTEKRIDLIDDLSSDRESRLRTMMALDRDVEIARMALTASEIKRLGEDLEFKNALLETVQLLNEIHLTDQSLFLYIQSIGGEVRSDILRQLKEKQTVSKFKSQGLPTTGEGLDKTL